MSIFNFDAIQMAVPAYRNDQIIGVVEETVVVGASSTSVRNTAHSFGDSCYYQGRFTTNGGATYNDFGAQSPDLSAPATPVFDTVSCNATSDPTNATITITNSTASPKTVTYQVYLLAKNTMASPLEPLNIPEVISWRSGVNYQKIAFASSTPISIAFGASGGPTVVHNLGRIPTVRAFFFASATPTVCRPLPAGIDGIKIQKTTTDVQFFSDQSFFLANGITGTVEYRIYHD